MFLALWNCALILAVHAVNDIGETLVRCFNRLSILAMIISFSWLGKLSIKLIVVFNIFILNFNLPNHENNEIKTFHLDFRYKKNFYLMFPKLTSRREDLTLKISAKARHPGKVAMIQFKCE